MHHAERHTERHRVNLRRPMSRYWIVAAASVVAWWCYRSGQTDLALLALFWGLSEF